MRVSHRAIGQLLIIGFDGTEMSSGLASLLQRIRPAGVILFVRNITSAEQTWRLLKDCEKQVGSPLFRCVDLEGGTVDRLRNVIGPTPAPAEVFATGDRKLFRKHGRVIGENCRALGFNVNFAPAVDLAFDASRPVMTSRLVSPDPRKTVFYAGEFLAGLRQAQVLGCGKHFPGLGEGKLDSHHQLPVIEKPFQKLWQQDLAPYRDLRRQMPFVMVAHAAYPEVTGNRIPASLAKKWMTEILRRRIGYTGLIVSDDLAMGGVLAAGPIEQAAVESVRAGADLCLVCHQEEFVTRVYQALIGEAERDSRFGIRLAEAAGKVEKVKRRLLASIRWKNPVAPGWSRIERLRRQLWEFGEQVRLETIRQQETE